MNNDLYSAIAVSMSGMRAQSTRMNVISQNIAHASTTGNTPDETPYTKQNITFKKMVDRERGVDMVDVKGITRDQKTPYPVKFMPDHPAADESGYVKMPNVRTLMEMNDMRDAQRVYEANLGMIEQSRNMVMQTIGLLRR